MIEIFVFDHVRATHKGDTYFKIVSSVVPTRNLLQFLCALKDLFSVISFIDMILEYWTICNS